MYRIWYKDGNYMDTESESKVDEQETQPDWDRTEVLDMISENGYENEYEYE